MDAVTLEDFADMLPAQRASIVLLGSGNCYEAATLKSWIATRAAAGLPLTDPLNPAYVVTPQEVADIKLRAVAAVAAFDAVRDTMACAAAIARDGPTHATVAQLGALLEAAHLAPAEEDAVAKLLVFPLQTRGDMDSATVQEQQPAWPAMARAQNDPAAAVLPLLAGPPAVVRLVLRRILRVARFLGRTDEANNRSAAHLEVQHAASAAVVAKLAELRTRGILDDAAAFVFLREFMQTPFADVEADAVRGLEPLSPWMRWSLAKSKLVGVAYRYGIDNFMSWNDDYLVRRLPVLRELLAHRSWVADAATMTAAQRSELGDGALLRDFVRERSAVSARAKGGVVRTTFSKPRAKKLAEVVHLLKATGLQE